ncbi:LrgB family protein [Clostridium sp. LY3-2]|uniref:LrgB family protein n=1 Tax=Clostridium sp. LY3-2 TaxID=2942482 RepID=UPI0021526351|nr:LrgB family protein [Clostridium sp. LY3-2]MCR6515111.1 LrgB family protein [Clostridium sp. LY3-2]
MELLTNNVFFGIVLSLIAFEIGIFAYKKTKLPIFNPLLIAIIVVIAFLTAFNIDFKDYNQGSTFINMFLGPSTVVLALPLYNQIELLKQNAIAIFIGIFCGTVVAIFSIMILSHYLGLNLSMIASLVPKSVTTPIGIAISSQLNGLVPVTVLAIILSGIIGAVIGPTICKICKVTNKIAVGISLGTASHAVGTSKALELGETEGAMSSLAIGIAGIMTVFVAPVALHVAMFFYKLLV